MPSKLVCTVTYQVLIINFNLWTAYQINQIKYINLEGSNMKTIVIIWFVMTFYSCSMIAGLLWIHSSWKINDGCLSIPRCNFAFLDHVLQIWKPPAAILESIIENSIPFPYFYWILVAYTENSTFYSKRTQNLVHCIWPRNYILKKCKLVQLWEEPGQNVRLVLFSEILVTVLESQHQ